MGIPYFVVYQDNIRVTGINKATHFNTLKIVLSKVISVRLKLKQRKFRLRRIEKRS